MWHNVKQKLRGTDKDSQDVWLNGELSISFLSGWTSITSLKKKNAPTSKSSLQFKHTQVFSCDRLNQKASSNMEKHCINLSMAGAI